MLFACIGQQLERQMAPRVLPAGQMLPDQISQPVELLEQRFAQFPVRRLGVAADLLFHRRLQFINPLATRRQHFHHRHAQTLAQRRRIHRPAQVARLVIHRQGHDYREAEVHHLGRQIQVAFEVAGVNHNDNEVDLALTGDQVEQQVADGLLILADRAQAVCTGQINQAELTAVVMECTFLALDGDAGVVPHLVAQPSEGIKQGGFTAVRVADKCGGQSACGLWLAIACTASLLDCYFRVRGALARPIRHLVSVRFHRSVHRWPAG